MSDDKGTPEQHTQSGFEGEVRRHFTTRAEVHEMLETLSTKVNTHLGYHEGRKFTATWVVPVVCVLITASAIIVSALVQMGG